MLTQPVGLGKPSRSRWTWQPEFVAIAFHRLKGTSFCFLYLYLSLVGQNIARMIAASGRVRVTTLRRMS